MIKNELNSIVDDLKSLGKMSFFEGVSENEIIEFEKKNNVSLSSQLKEWYLFSDGGEFFLPAGLQLYGISHKPLIDMNNEDRPNDNYFVIGTLSDGNPVLSEKNSEKIYIYNHGLGIIESDEIYPDFFTFLKDLPNIFGI